MSKFLSHYGIQPRIRRKSDNFVVLERRQLFDHAARRWLEHNPDKVLRTRCRGLGRGPTVRVSHCTLTSASPSSFQEIWRWDFPSCSVQCELLTPSVLLSVYCRSAFETIASWVVPPKLNVILDLLTRWMSKESVLTRSCGSEGSFEHDSVSVRGTESPEAYIFGDGSVSCWRYRISDKSLSDKDKRPRPRDKYLGGRLQFLKRGTSRVRAVNIDCYESFFFISVAD